MSGTEEKSREIRRDFSRVTSCHGFAQMYASSYKYQKIFWCVLTVVVFVVLISQLAIRLGEYVAYKTTTSIAEIYTDNLMLPAFTICNFNHFFGVETIEEKNAIDELAKARRVFEETSIDYEKLGYFDKHYNGSIRKYTIDKGWELNGDTLIWCQTGTDDCTADNFTYSITELGKCWTFKNPIKVPGAGSQHGVSIIVDVRQEEYTESPIHGRWEAGIKVQVHPVHDVPEVDQFGSAIPVGFMGFLAIRKIEEKIMYKPWGECEPDKEVLPLFDTYSTANCMKNCSQWFVERTCDCRPYTMKHSHLGECNPKETVCCLKSVTSNRDRITTTRCGCQPPCNHTEYDAKISYAALPNIAIQKGLSLANNITKEYTRENFVGVNIFFERMSYTEQEESMAITFSGLLSDLGGQLGLWVGISVVTIFEFVQLLVFCCMRGAHCIRKREGQKAPPGETSTDSQNRMNKEEEDKPQPEPSTRV